MNRLCFLVVIFMASLHGRSMGNDGTTPLMRSDLAAAGLIPVSAEFCKPSDCESADLSALLGTLGNFDATEARGVVDWVLVEASTATDGAEKWCQTALLLENSVIVDPLAYTALSADEKTRCLNGDGEACPLLYFSETDGTLPLHFSVKHHNHLGVKTTETITVDDEAELFVFDFGTTGVSATSQSACGEKNCLTAGDLDGDGTVGKDDAQFFLNYQADSRKPFAYTRADGDLDGAVNVEDVVRGVSPNLGSRGDLGTCAKGSDSQ